MNNIKQALESAIEAMYTCDLDTGTWSVVDIALATYKCKAALAELEKCEPVATIQAPDPYDERDGVWFNLSGLQRLKKLATGTKLYTSPPQQQWVGLSDNEIDKMWEFYRGGWYDFAMAIEGKLKELNT